MAMVQTSKASARRRRARRAAVAAGALAASLAMVGCQTVDAPGFLGKILPSHDESMADGMPRPETSTPGRFLSRYLNPSPTPHSSAAKEPKALQTSNSGWTPIKEEPNPKADAELDVATRLYRQGKHEEAEHLFVELAKKYKGSSWGQRAQFLLAESYFQREKYVWASEAYEQLMKEYPGNDHVDKVVSREYEIAQKWFKTYDPKAKPEDKFPWTSRFDGTVPFVDASGFAIKNLEHVRFHDPTGPLSDDAVLRLADHYFENHDYDSASLYYDQLVTDHPKSEFLQRAQLRSIDAKLKAYSGPEYDGKGLEKAREMIIQTKAAFPDRPAGNEKLYDTLNMIDDQEAERAYRVAMFYKKTNYITSAEYYFSMVRALWPKSDWAKKSKTELALIAKLPRKETLPSKIMSLPGSTDPFSAGQGGSGMGTNGGGTGGMGGMNALGGMGGMGGAG
jgi:TolA-binding protein